MSSYENYDAAARCYDDTRVPNGVVVILGCLALTGKRLDEMVVLDAGCGTGNYARAVLEYVGRVEAVDLSRGMLQRARAKLAQAEAAGRVRFHEGSITALPLDDGLVDAVMTNQVLHHLPDTADEGYPGHRAVLQELFRVLRPGGVIIINTASQRQIQEAFWYMDLIPDARARVQQRFAPITALEGLLEQVGFAVGGRVVPLGASLQGEALLDPRGPLRKEWRDGDSTWSLATPEELDQALARIREMDAAGTLDQYVARLDARRLSLGQTTFVYGFRPAESAG